jgi:hypothetical protein
VRALARLSIDHVDVDVGAAAGVMGLFFGGWQTYTDDMHTQPTGRGLKLGGGLTLGLAFQRHLRGDGICFAKLLPR